MIQNQSGPGRPLGFDRDAVVDELVRAFWEEGYEGVSLQDLEQRTGLNRSSLYNSFGSKESLFSNALDRYLDEVAGRLLIPLEGGRAGIADLHAFVDALSDWFASRESAAGCLMVNSMIEFGGSQERIVDEACRYTERFRIAATAAMRWAVERGEVEAGNLDARVDLMVGMVLALNVAARSGVPGLPGRLVEALRVQVASWESG